MKLFLKILNGIISAVLVLIIAGAAILAFTARRSPDAIPTVAGRKVLSVLSGSMQPAIRTGDVIIVRPLAAGEPIQDGDVVTYKTKEKADMLITHRVVGTVLINGKPAAYVTKGDANQSQDLDTVTPDRIVGKYQWRVPLFGYISSFMRKPIGIILMVILPGLVLIGLEFKKMYQTLSEAEKAQAPDIPPAPALETEPSRAEAPESGESRIE